MLFGGGNRNQTCQTCWKQLPFGFKFLFVLSLGYNALTIIFSFLLTEVIFEASKVVLDFQLWRLLFPFIPAGAMPSSILNILINFMLLLSIFPPLEKRLSTAFILVETLVQNLLINTVLTVMGLLCYYIFALSPGQFPIYSFGMFPLCIVFIWYQVAQNPDQHTTFCCMPCLIQMKWIPLILLAMSLIFASPLIFALLIAFALGYLQFMHLKKRFIRLPVRFYRKIDQILPKSITDRPDYVKVQSVENQLNSQCSKSAVNNSRNNPFAPNQDVQIQAPNKVQVIGKGVSIGGGNSNAENFKGFWANKVEKLNQQIQIEPIPVKNPQFKIKKQSPKQQMNFLTQESDSKAQLNLNNSSQKQSQEQLGQEQQKKVSKRNLLQ